MFRPKRLKNGQAGGAGDGRSVGHPARLAWPGNDDRPGLSFSCRPCATRRGDADAVSHKLLVRAGFIRQVSAGLWTFMPLGWRVHRKIEQIIREEMDAIGGQEMLMPVLTPAELREATSASGSRRSST
jgi:hypothetical protein